MSEQTTNSEEQVTKPEKPITKLEEMIGRNWFFRTVTFHLTGRVTGIINGNILSLEDAAYIADTPRFQQFIQDGQLDEVEPVGVMYVNLDTVTDFFPWVHKLPIIQK